MNESEYCLFRLFTIGPYRVDFLRKKYWKRKKILGLPWIIVEKKMPNGHILVRSYFK